MLGRTKVTKFKNSRFRIKKKILRLDVPVTNALCMDVGKAAKHLIHVQLDKRGWDGLLAFRILPCNLVHRFWYELKNKIEVDFIFFFSGGVEEVEQLDNVAVFKTTHYLLRKVTILIEVRFYHF